MKKIFMWLLFALSITTFVSSGNISVNNTSVLNTQCNIQESLDVNYYLENSVNNITRSPYDTFGNNIDSLISASSSVDIWRNNWILTNCNDWSRVSNVAVANSSIWSLAIQNYDGCVFNKPSTPKHNDPNKIDAQVHFNIVYQKVFEWAPNSITTKFYHRSFGQNNWTCYPGGNIVPSYSDCPNVKVKYGINNTHSAECLNYRVFWCGDGILNSPSWQTNYTNWSFSEQCDPNDPAHQGWGNGWCSVTCEPIQQIQVPSCTLDIVQTPNLAYNINYNIVGTFNPTQINITPPLVNFPNHNITANAWTIVNIVPNGYGTFTASMTVTNSAWSFTCQDTFFVPQPEIKSCGDGKIDRPNNNGVYEECDNGPSFGDWCNNQCKLMTPSCVLMADSQFQLVWNPVTFTANKDVWARYFSFNLWDTIFGTPNIIHTGNIVFPYQHMYTNMLSYNPVLMVQNNHANIATGVVRPTAICDTDIKVVNGCEITVEPYIMNLWEVAQVSWEIWPDFNIPSFMNVSPALVWTWPHNIYYKTWHTFVWPNITNTWNYVFSINAWTINGYPFSCTWNLYVWIEPLLGELDINKILLSTGDLMPWDFVDYRIELTNIWSGTFYDAYINDVMPTSLDLVYHNLIWVYPYESADWQDINGNWFFEYSGFNLLPWQSIYVNVRWQIRDNASANNTTNCAFTSGDHSCVIYDLASDPYILKSQMMSNSIINTMLTTGVINVNTGDYITYRIDFANMWWEKTTWGVRVIDHMPLCVNYVSANIYGVSNAIFSQIQDINWRQIIEYSGFDLLAGQWWYMIVTGQIVNSALCNNYTTYTNDSYIHFYNPMVVRQSSTTAIRANKSVVVVTKDSNPDIHLPWDDKLFTIQVQNLWPNPISNISLQDIWPNSTCISYVDRTGNSWFTKNPTSLVWNRSDILAPWASLNLYISGSITNNQACVNPDYENIINLRYTEMWVEYTDQANYHFAVNATPVANISLVKTANKNIVSSGDSITYTIIYQNMWNTALNSYVITDYWPGMIEFVSASPFPSSIVNLTTWANLIWNFYNPLLPWQTWQIIVQWKVK